MREALAALTGRGRGFLAAGLTAILCGVVFGEKDLVRIGVLVGLLPIVSAVWVAHARHRLRLTRTLSSAQIEVGQHARVRLELTNLGPATGVLLLEEQVPYTLGSQPRFVVDSVQAGEKRTIEYSLMPEVRGGYPIGPLRIRVGDPFGLLELHRTFSATTHLVVTPRVESLPPISLRGVWAGTGENRPRSFTSGNAADVTVRDYRLGDDLRRIHWRSSAHAGDLMVRREEQPWQSRCTLLIDNRSQAHRGRGAGSSLEAAIVAGASVALHLARQGYQVRLVSASGEELGQGWHDGELAVNTRPLLEGLALLPGTSARTLSTDWMDESVTNAMFLAVLGAVDDGDHPFFSRVRSAGGAAYALALDVDAWIPSQPARPPATAWLQSSGWKTVTLRPDTPLATAWQELGR